jgi:hypothetical protein
LIFFVVHFQAVSVNAALKSVLSDIEWGVLSGLFEFTVINADPATALLELQTAAGYLTKKAGTALR